MITLKVAKKAIEKVLKHKLVPILTSSPGIGKSQMVAQIAKEHNLKLLDIRLAQLEPCDLNGMPKLGETKASYLPMDIFPLQGDKIPKGYKGWLLFLDELRNADVSVQQAAYRIILDREIGNNKLHDNCFIICAGNREEDGCFVQPMPSALKSRMVHFNVELDVKEWLDYARKNSFDYRIISFIGYKNNLLNTAHDYNKEDAYASPRTWEFLSKMIKDEDITTPEYNAIIKGTVGEAVGIEFLAFNKYFNQLPKFEDILKNPEKAPVPESADLGLTYATIGMVAEKATIKNAETLMKYVQRLDSEFQFFFIQNLSAKYPSEVLELDFIDDYLTKLGEVLCS